MTTTAASLEELLVEQAHLSAETLEKAHERQRDGKGLGDVLLEMGAIDSSTWARALATHYGLPFRDQLPEDATVAGPQRSPKRELGPSRPGRREEQIRDIDACDGQDQASRPQDDPKRAA